MEIELFEQRKVEGAKVLPSSVSTLLSLVSHVKAAGTALREANKVDLLPEELPSSLKGWKSQT